MTSNQSKATTILVGGFGLAALAAAAIGIATAVPAAQAASAPVALQSQAEWKGEVSTLQAGRTSADALPAFLLSGEQELVDFQAESAVAQGEASGVRYWTITRNDGKLCLLAVLQGKDQLSVISCSPDVETFKQTGLGLQAAGNDASTVAYLVPDGYADSADSVGLSKVGPNLIAGDPYVSRSESSLSPNAGAAGRSATSLPTLELPLFGEPDDF